MHTEKTLKLRKLGLQIAMAGAASATLASTPVFAQDVEAEFNRLDQNSDQLLQWNELQPRLEAAQIQRGRDQILGEYDRDNDQALALQEFQPLLVVSADAEQNVDDAEQVVVQSQQPKVVVDTDPPKVKVDPAEPEVAVEQQPAKVVVDPANPQVAVEQVPPKIIVTQPKPQIEVTVPEPEVEVVMRDPNVNVDTPKPEVEVVQPKPEVTVNQGKPEVAVQQSEPEVAVVPAKPRVAVDAEEDARVAIRDDADQAQVEVAQADAKVRVAEADAKVAVDEAQDANVNVVEGEEEAAANVEQAETEQNPLFALRVADVEGQTVLNRAGDELGDIDRVVTNNQTNQPALVIVKGGVLGFGEEEILIPLDEVQLNNDQLIWETDQTLEELENAPGYNDADYTEVTAQDQVIGEL
ncbi:MAG: PRC-barrel domain-containing protein [Halomonas sp.]|nr:PRC-barrel domain-containing protein [Halomonas sp.]